MTYPYVTLIHEEDGGNKLVIESGGTLEVQAGATVTGLDGAATFASSAEAKAGSVTDKNIAPDTLHAVLVNCKIGSFTGVNGVGPCDLNEAAVGDKVIGVTGLSDMGMAYAAFETTITVADQIQQTLATDLSTKNYLVILLPNS